MITNRPIRTQASLGVGAAMFGLVTQSMVPGLMMAVGVHAISLGFVEGNHMKALPFSFTIASVYWLYVGNNKKRAWENITRHVRVPDPYIGSTESRSLM